MSIIALNFIKSVSSRSEASGLLNNPCDVVLIERGIPRILLISCPCGCGEEFPINLDSRAGKAWDLYKNKRTGISLYPSVWRDTGCQSHYIIWRDHVLLFNNDYDDFELSAENDSDDLADIIIQNLPEDGLVDFVQVAKSLNEIPWDILKICRQLKRKGLVREGIGKERGLFGRVKK